MPRSENSGIKRDGSTNQLIDSLSFVSKQQLALKTRGLFCSQILILFLSISVVSQTENCLTSYITKPILLVLQEQLLLSHIISIKIEQKFQFDFMGEMDILESPEQKKTSFYKMYVSMCSLCTTSMSLCLYIPISGDR